MWFLKRIKLCLVPICFLAVQAFSQTYLDESGKRIVQADYEEKILNGPYFGVPSGQEGTMKVVHRMPVGVTNAKLIYETLGLQPEFQAGKPLIVIYYPGKDECNSTGSNDRAYLNNKHKSLLKYAEKHEAVAPLYFYKNPHGLEKYQGILEWSADPEGLFEKLFFQFHYPCGSFVVISPKGNFRAILGEYPISQVDVALKKL